MGEAQQHLSDGGRRDREWGTDDATATVEATSWAMVVNLTAATWLREWRSSVPCRY
jgi:hypothetical protein